MKDILLIKLEKEIKKCNRFAEALNTDRYTDIKPEDKWYTEAFEAYTMAKAKIEILIELLHQDQT